MRAAIIARCSCGILAAGGIPAERIIVDLSARLKGQYNGSDGFFRLLDDDVKQRMIQRQLGYRMSWVDPAIAAAGLVRFVRARARRDDDHATIALAINAAMGSENVTERLDLNAGAGMFEQMMDRTGRRFLHQRFR